MRKAHDFYETPPRATRALLARERFGAAVWEPACGTGRISKLLIEAGYQVRSSDLIDRGYGSVENFLTSNRKVESIATNPPFCLAERFVWKALASTTYKVAFLLRLKFLESQERRLLFRVTPLKTVYVFRRRLDFSDDYSKGHNKICFCWFVWEHGYRGKPEVEWM